MFVTFRNHRGQREQVKFDDDVKGIRFPDTVWVELGSCPMPTHVHNFVNSNAMMYVLQDDCRYCQQDRARAQR